MIFNMTGGGVSTALNFNVVGGTTAPVSPKENTIWVNTDTEITSWVFSSSEPQNPTEGMVWFFTSTSSLADFNALKKSESKKNDFMVYPSSPKQYTNGVWADVTAKSYQNGEWVEWILYLYTSGNEQIDITGGWSADGVTASSTPVSGTLESDHMYIGFENGSSTGSVYSVMFADNKIPITAAMKKLCFTYTQLAVANGESFDFGVRNTKNVDNYVAKYTCKAAVGTTTTGEIDVSTIVGEYYIGFDAWIGSTTTRAIKVYEIWLE